MAKFSKEVELKYMLNFELHSAKTLKHERIKKFGQKYLTYSNCESPTLLPSKNP